MIAPNNDEVFRNRRGWNGYWRGAWHRPKFNPVITRIVWLNVNCTVHTTIYECSFFHASKRLALRGHFRPSVTQRAIEGWREAIEKFFVAQN